MSIELYDLPNGIWFKGQFIREGDGLYLGTSDEFFRGGLEGISRCLKANGQDAGVCVRFENIRIMKESDFHRHCRVVYRAMRKQYGIEKVQDECLRVFKVIYPLYFKAKNGGEFDFDEITHERLGKIFSSWNVQEGSKLDDLLFTVRDRMINEEFTKESFLEFCDDCLVVVMKIRKLTQRECGRLMNVDDKDIDKIEACGISKSAQYKIYGNSIVVNVLYHIFRKLFIETEPDIVKGEAVQLSLF